MQRHFRLRRSEDFARLRREGHSYRHSMMTLSIATNGLTHNRYGFITGKHLGSAVIRNRVRRLLRESVRLLHPRLRAGFDLVLIARQPVSGQPFAVVQRIVNTLAQQAGLVVEGEEG
jgi:ribonuclease P protein component